MKFLLKKENITTMERGDLIQSVKFEHVLLVLKNDGENITFMSLTDPREKTASLDSFIKPNDKYVYYGTLHNGLKTID